MPDLPPEIIADVLSRLPVKPLLRFRCVSKPWCALIDSPDFINMHLARSIQTRTNRSVVLNSSEPLLYSIDFDSLDQVVELDHPLKSEENHGAQVWGSCNGLLCLSNLAGDLALWNPSTKKHRNLPFCPVQTPPPSCDFQMVVCGFGFNSVSDDYKVVRIVQNRCEDVTVDAVSDDYKVVRIVQNRCEDVTVDAEVRSYSLKSNSWRVQEFPYSLNLVYSPGLLVGGALHWKISAKPGDDDQPSYIIAFDLGAEGFHIVPRPDYKESKFYWNFRVWEGCLCVMFCDSLEGYEVWVMEEYGVKESWTKWISIKPSNLIRPLAYFKPLAYSKNGGKILIQHETHRFVWYDLEGKIIERVSIRDLPERFESNACFGSLVPLGGGGGSDGKKQAAQDKTKIKNKRKKRDDFLSEGFKLVL